MSTETANLIVACASLVVMVVTFFITFRMYVYMKKSDLMRSRNEEKRRKKDIMAQIESKKNELERMNTMSRLVGSGVSQQQIFKLENEISELYSRL
jgi:hypothetical protein